MKILSSFNKSKYSFIYILIIVTLVTALYRVIPNRIPGFAPQIATIIILGFFISRRIASVGLIFLSMFLSDSIYEILYRLGYSNIYGFYGMDQFFNYVFLISLIGIIWLLKKPNTKKVILSTFMLPSVFYFISNSYTWLTGGGYSRPMNFGGYLQCMTDGIPFYWTSLSSTIFFTTLYFGLIFFIEKAFLKKLKKTL